MFFIQNPPLALRPRTSFFPKRLHSAAPLNHLTLIQSKSRRAVMNLSAAMSSDRKMLHAVYRVGNLASSCKFLEALGMHVLRERDVPNEKYTNVFFGFGSERRGSHFSIELTYNYGVSSYDVGTGFGHFTVAIQDVRTTVDKVKAAGFAISKVAGAGPDGTTYAIVVDPTGYHFELVERKQRDPLCQIMLRTTDVEKAVKFYKAMGMHELKRLNDEITQRIYMGFGPEDDSTVLQLLFTKDMDSFTSGNGYAQIAVSCPNVYNAAKQFKDAGITVTREPGPVPGIGTKICAVRDPDGWKTVLVDEEDFEKELLD